MRHSSAIAWTVVASNPLPEQPEQAALVPKPETGSAVGTVTGRPTGLIGVVSHHVMYIALSVGSGRLAQAWRPTIATNAEASIRPKRLLPL